MLQIKCVCICVKEEEMVYNRVLLFVALYSLCHVTHVLRHTGELHVGI